MAQCVVTKYITSTGEPSTDPSVRECIIGLNNGTIYIQGTQLIHDGDILHFTLPIAASRIMINNTSYTISLKAEEQYIKFQNGSVVKLNNPSMKYRFVTIGTSQTWTCPSNIASPVSVMVFGGGGGGGSYASAEGGGGGGHMAHGSFNIPAGTQVVCTIGAGGAAGNSTSAVAGFHGSAGGTSSFGSYLSAAGGEGGTNGGTGTGISGGNGGSGGGAGCAYYGARKGGTASYGGAGGDGSSRYVGGYGKTGSTGINTTTLSNPLLVKGTGTGGAGGGTYASGGGGGGYGSAGGAGGTCENGSSSGSLTAATSGTGYACGGGAGGGHSQNYIQTGGGGGGGYGGTGGNAARDTRKYSDGTMIKGAAGTSGVILLSYLTLEERKDPLYSI